MRGCVHACVIAASVLAPAASAHAGPLTLKAQAGIAGLGRAGRWAPVRVSIDNTDRDFTGEVVVAWGDAVVRRAVSVASPGRADLVLYIRSADVRDVVSVRMESNGDVVRSIDAPIRLQSADDDLTICVGSADGTGRDQCAATMTTVALPRAMWGYDAVDHVRWDAASPDALDRDQRRAFEQWTAKRTLDDAGVVLTQARPLPNSDDSGGSPVRLAAVGTSIYLALLVGATTAARKLQRQPLVVYGVVLAFAVAGSAAALAAGRVGPSSAVVVTHSSHVVQLPMGGSIVSMKASAQYPAFDAFVLHARSTGAAMFPETGSRSELRLDESGEPILRGVFGLGSHRAFDVEAVLAFSPFRLSRQDGTMTVANASAFDYRDCYFSDGLSRTAAGVLRMGQTLAVPAELSRGTFFDCALSATPVDFDDPRHAVRTEGTTELVVYLDAFGPQGDR